MNAHEMRLKLAASQRMTKTKEKWVNFAEQVKENFSHHTEKEGMRIGDKVKFAKTKVMSGGCIQVSSREGVVFALGEKSFYVVSYGKLERVRY
jgi:hypothetical protein